MGLTQSLWNEDERYVQSYWSTWPNLWHHGDFASRDEDGHWYIWGRSDDTLKIAGKRTGPAEIEALLMASGKLGEAAAIGVPDSIKGSALVLVCVPKAGVSPSPELKAQLSETVVHGLGTPFKPRDVVLISDLPKTRNLKIMRRVIRATYLGRAAGDVSSLENPDAVKAIGEAR